MRFGIAAVLSLAAFSLTGPTHAQDIQISSSQNVLIQDGAFPSFDALTDFGSVTNGPRTRSFIVRNLDTATTLTIAIIGSSSPNVFQLNANDEFFTIPPGDSRPLGIRFQSNVQTQHTATITIQNNTPGDKGVYTFGVTALRLAPPPPDRPDLYIRVSKVPKVKFNKSTQLLTVKFKVEVSNLGSTTSLAPTLNVLSSSGPVIQLPVQPVSTVTLKPLPPPKNGKAKTKKATITLTDVANVPRYLFVFASTPGIEDEDAEDNAVSGHYDGVAF